MEIKHALLLQGEDFRHGMSTELDLKVTPIPETALENPDDDDWSRTMDFRVKQDPAFDLDPEFVSFHHIIRLLMILFIVPLILRIIEKKT